MPDYSIVIERGHDAINDEIFDILLPKLEGYVLDIGCNTGALLAEYAGNGFGIDASPTIVNKAKELGRNVMLMANTKPFPNRAFDTVVLSCVLEQNENWEDILKDAMRIGRKVIGINPIPNKGQWGRIGGWVKAVIPAQYLFDHYSAKIEWVDSERYYFEIWTSSTN